jgi:hypothetical protein
LPITLSATASSGLTVSFSVVSGPATISVNTLTITGAGTVVIAANQPGNNNYTAAPQVTNSVVVNQPYDTAIQLQFSSTQLVYPGATNVTICITPSTRATTTGSVKIYDGTTLLTTQLLQGGGCAYWYISPGLSAGTHVMTAVYSGDSNNLSGNSAPITLTVAPVPVNMSSSCWNASFPYGANYQCTVNVSSNAGAAQGSITYSYNGGSAVAVPLSGGNAQFTITEPTVGTQKVVISYAQQSNYATAIPQTETFTVTPAPVNVALTPSSWYASAGSNVTFQVAVTSWSAGAPNANGAVSFYDGSNLLSTVEVNSSGQASYSTSTLPAGAQTITAAYASGTNYASGSSSVTITLTP